MRPSRLPIAATLALAPTIALAQGAVAPMPLPRGTTGPADNLTVGGRPIPTLVGLSTYSMPPPSGSAAADAANFAAAQASGARRVLFQSGVYLVPPTGYPALRSNQCVSGQGSGATTLRITGPGTYAEGVLSAFGAKNFCLTGLTVDYAGFKAHPTPNIGTISLRDVGNVRLDDVNITGFPYMGLSLNGAIDLVYDRGSLVRAAKPLDSAGAAIAPGVQNQCVNGSVSSSPISRVRFQDVACTGSGFDMSGSDVDYVRPSVDGFDFGFAYVTEYGSERHRFYNAVARNGRTNPATGQDVNHTAAGCFEIWSPGSVVDGALCDNVGGAGVALGGKNSRVTNSTFTRLGMQVASNGIGARYEEGGLYSADGAYIAGNTVVNSNGTGDGSNLVQPYADTDTDMGLKITIGPNDFPAIPATRKGASTAWAAPGMLVTAMSDRGYDHPSGTRQSPAARTVQGVRRGRDVVLGATFRAVDGSALPAGLRLSAVVDADNSVRFYLEDISGGSTAIAVPVGTYSARLITIN